VEYAIEAMKVVLIGIMLKVGLLSSRN